MTCKKIKNGIVCDFRTLPDKHECREAIWSLGKSCKSCYRSDCYRKGWTQAQATADNRNRVAENFPKELAGSKWEYE